MRLTIATPTRLAIAATLLAAAAAPSAAQANPSRELPAECATATSQTAINACAARGYRQADSALTQEYQHALSTSTGARQTALRNAQRAWVAYRDAHCRYATIGFAGRSAEAMRSLCLASLTRGRTRELEQSAANTGVGPGAVGKPRPVPLPAKPPGGVSAPSVSGTVSYRERIALPEGAVLSVRLEDVSRQNAAAILVAERTIPLAGQQVPIPFTLAYNAGAINANNQYVVRATIRAPGTSTGPGQLLFTTTRSYPVITRGNPSVVTITAERARAP